MYNAPGLLRLTESQKKEKNVRYDGGLLLLSYEPHIFLGRKRLKLLLNIHISSCDINSDMTVIMPRCEGLPSGPCPAGEVDLSVKGGRRRNDVC